MLPCAFAIKDAGGVACLVDLAQNCDLLAVGVNDQSFVVGLGLELDDRAVAGGADRVVDRGVMATGGADRDDLGSVCTGGRGGSEKAEGGQRVLGASVRHVFLGWFSRAGVSDRYP